MSKFGNQFAKGGIAAATVGAMALASATPAQARDRHHDRGISTGDVIAGAVILGGIAAIASATSKKDRYNHRNDRYRTDRYRGQGYDNRNYNRGYNANVRYKNRGYTNGRSAVERCVRVAERQARRFGGFRHADVTQIRDVDRTRYGFRVKGRIEVSGARGYGNQGYDRGKFTCYLDGQGRPQVDFKNIRGLR
ncbi:MAG: hypothetical protein ABJ239_10170 [Erythrobacter sp.]